VRRVRPRTTFAGSGGARLRAAGVQLACDTSEWASIGPISALAKIPALYVSMRRLERALRTRPPKLLITVDFGAFHLRLLQRLRRAGYGGQALYYFPPGAWLDSALQARAVAAVATALTPFEHQHGFYGRLGLQAFYFGHPLVSVIPQRPARDVAASPCIAILPGSRAEEVARHVPVLARAASALSASSARFEIVAASGSRSGEIGALWRRHGGPPANISRAHSQAVFDRADLAWVASGTAVLEAALRGIPQVTFYRVSGLQYRIAKRRVPKLVAGPITLPNLVLGRRAVPELLQDGFTPRALIEGSIHLLRGGRERNASLHAYRDLRRALGPPDALGRIAAFVASQLANAG